MHTMDVSYIYRSLHIAITEEYTNKSADIEVVFGFLLHRLVSLESCLRARARRCFAGILDPSLFVPPDSLGENFNWLMLLDKFQFQHHFLEQVSLAICRAILLESSHDVVSFLKFMKFMYMGTNLHTWNVFKGSSCGKCYSSWSASSAFVKMFASFSDVRHHINSRISS